MTKFWISRMVLDEMRTLADSSSPSETGGMLLGYIAVEGDVVVTAIIGPGPNAKHSRFAFEHDAEYQQYELEAYFRATKGTKSYLGDWHTHPFGSCNLSTIDKHTLFNIASTPSSKINNPVMAILAGAPTGYWRLGAVRFLGMKKRFFSKKYHLETLEVIVF